MLALLLIACHKTPADSDEPAGDSAIGSETDSPTDDSGRGDGGTGGAGDGGTGGDGGGTGGTDTSAPPSDFDLQSTDEETWASTGYRGEVWVDNTGVVGVDGQPASFTWIRPAEGPVTGVLLYLHGSTAADDSADPADCPIEAAETAQLRFLVGWGVVPWLAMERGMAVLSPLNTWCDVWLGQGPDDPVDTSHHGWSMIERSLDWALGPHSGVGVDGPVVAWGTSTGSVGAALAAARRDEVLSAVLDSGPIDFEDRSQLEFAAVLQHVLGGSPEAEPERYRANSPVALIEDGLLTKPLFEATNAHDQITVPAHGQATLAAFQAAYDPAGLRYGWHDFNHYAPGDTYHTQTALRFLPWSYTASVLMDFLLDGVNIDWREAEDPCGGCTVGERLFEGDWPTAASNNAVIIADTAEGAGLIYSAPPAAGVQPGDSPRGTAVLYANDLEGLLQPEDQVATLRWLVDGAAVAEKPVYFGDLSVDSALSELSRHVEATTLAAPGVLPEGAEVFFQVETTGRALLLLDAVIYGW